MKCLFLVASVLVVAFGSLQAQDLPDGPGKAVLENTCGTCHGPDLVLGQVGPRDYWQSIVDSMRGRGAMGTEDDFTAIVNYLTRFLGVPVNVNTAAAKSMATDLEITADEADAIVKYRTDKGKFKDWSDLAKVPGLDTKKLEPIKNRIKF